MQDGKSVQGLAGHRKLLRGGHLVAEGFNHPHPLIRRGRGSFLDRPPFLGPVPVEELRCSAEGGRLRRIEAGFEEKGQVLREPQERQLAFPEPCRVEVRAGQDLFDLVDLELHDLDLRAGVGWHESPQAMIVLPVEGPADDDGVKHGPGARAAGLPKQILDDVERAGASAGHGAYRVQLIDDQDARAIGVFGCRREHQDRGFFKTEVPHRDPRWSIPTGTGCGRGGTPAPADRVRAGPP